MGRAGKARLLRWNRRKRAEEWIKDWWRRPGVDPAFSAQAARVQVWVAWLALALAFIALIK